MEIYYNYDEHGLLFKLLKFYITKGDKLNNTIAGKIKTFGCQRMFIFNDVVCLRDTTVVIEKLAKELRIHDVEPLIKELKETISFILEALQ